MQFNINFFANSFYLSLVIRENVVALNSVDSSLIAHISLKQVFDFCEPNGLYYFVPST